MVRRSHHAKAAFDDDPLVPIDCGMLRALIEDLGLKVADLARDTGDSHQTISNLCKSEGMATCRSTRRQALAAALGVPEEMLARGRVFIPYMPALPDGYEMLYSSRTMLTAARLLTKVTNACERDLGDPELSPPQYARFAPREAVLTYVGWYVSDFMKIGEWRKRLIDWNPSELEARGYSEPATEDPWTEKERPTSDEDHEVAVLGFTRSLEHTLSPWFEGKASFNYRGLRDLVHLPDHPFAGATERVPPTSPYAVLLPSAVANVEAGSRKQHKKPARKKKNISKKKSTKKGRR